MIKDCITDETKIFPVITDSELKFNNIDRDKLDLIASKISEETGLPKELIYSPPYIFFIKNWYKIDGEWYYFKRDTNTFKSINELLGEVISEYFGLETVHFKIAELIVSNKSKCLGVLSKNLCNRNFQYTRAWDHGFQATKDLSILERLRDICFSDEEYLMLLNDIKALFIRDFYTSQVDRTVNNFLFKRNAEGIRLAPLYDYEDSFVAAHMHRYRNQIGELDITNRQTKGILRNDDKFQELLELLLNANISLFIENIEDAHRVLVPDYLKAIYTKHDKDIKKLVLKKRIIKK